MKCNISSQLAETDRQTAREVEGRKEGQVNVYK